MPESAIPGPPWMSDDEWRTRVERYRKVGFSEGQIRSKAHFLKPPLSREEVVRQATAKNVVFREEYLSPSDEALVLDHAAWNFPNIWLAPARDRIVIDSALGWVNPRSRSLYKVGIHSFVMRGGQHHERALINGDFRPGTPVALVREPDNEHDPNAVAQFPRGAITVAGYAPRLAAKRLAAVIDRGADLVTVSIKGSGPGEHKYNPHLIVVERLLWNHLNRKGFVPRL